LPEQAVQVRTAIVGCGLLVLGVAAVFTGILPIASAIAVWDRTWPILLFVAAITVVAELAAEAGLFDAVAHWAGHAGRGRGWLLWLLVVAIAALSTIFLSIDTTAVLLTPVMVVLARHVGISPLPFAVTTVWLANTGSLLLPVSNLTNLLALHVLGDPTPAAFAALTWLPAVIAVLVPVAVVFLVYRRQLMVRYRSEPPVMVEDPVLFRWAGAVIVVLIPLLVTGVLVWLPATVAAVVLCTAFATRRRSALHIGLVPWQLILFAGGLFLVVDAAHGLGLGRLLAGVSGRGSDPLDLLRFAATGAVGANAVNNLPAYLALEPSADTPARVIALLIGANVGPLITPWASLATLLWHQRLRSMDVTISWSRYVLLGLIVAPVSVVLATLAFAWWGGA